MNKKISLSLVATLCVAIACMSFYSIKSFNVNQTPTAKAKPAAKPAAKPLSPEEKTIVNYLKKNNLKAKKTASGLYYIITTKGTGAKVTAGKNVTVNYTGTLLDGTKFDSSTDPAFGHVQPLGPFQVGSGRVIKGWDEGLQLYNVGGKGKLIIPSALAYGPNPNGKIPANSVLVFDIEIVSQQ